MKLLMLYCFLVSNQISYSQEIVDTNIIEHEKLIDIVVAGIDSNKSLKISNIRGLDSLQGEYTADVVWEFDPKEIKKIKYLFDALDKSIEFYFVKDQLILVFEGTSRFYFISNFFYDIDGKAIENKKLIELLGWDRRVRRSILKILH